MREVGVFFSRQARHYLRRQFQFFKGCCSSAPSSFPCHSVLQFSKDISQILIFFRFMASILNTKAALMITKCLTKIPWALLTRHRIFRGKLQIKYFFHTSVLKQLWRPNKNEFTFRKQFSVEKEIFNGWTFFFLTTPSTCQLQFSTAKRKTFRNWWLQLPWAALSEVRESVLT